MLNFKIIALLSAPYLLGHPSQITGTVKSKLPITGSVPGNPQAEIAKFHTLSAVLSTYSKLHAGAYPPSGTDLLKEILRNMPAYRFHSFPQVLSIFRNPDAKFADDPGVRAAPQSSLAFTLPQTRPDGSPKDKRKAPGLRDVEAYSDLYYHQNIKHYSGDRTVSRPTGFYIVLWDNDKVETIAYDKILYVPSGPNTYKIGFPGEAGVPKDARTYQQLYFETNAIHPPHVYQR